MTTMLSKVPHYRVAVQRFQTSRVFFRNISRLSAVHKDEIPCWKCKGGNCSCCDFFCKKCGVIRKVDGNCSYFDILKTPQNFGLNIGTIESKYKNLQKQLHPDRFGSKTETEREFSSLNSSLVNKAYSTLKDPVSRVQYILQLHGIQLPGIKLEKEADKTMLLEIMEKRERIDECESPADLELIRQEVENDIERFLGALQEAYDIKENIETTTNLAIRLRYFTKILFEIEKKEEKLMKESALCKEN